MEYENIGVFFLHAGCNMRCRFCITDNRCSAMRFEQAVHLLDHVQLRGVNNVVLGGGEPFTWVPGVTHLAEVAKARGFLVQVGTNGIGVPANFAALPQIDRYVLPLDSVDSALHNGLRTFDRSHYHIILERLDALREHDKSVTVSTVVNAQNVDSLKDLGVFLANYMLGGARLHAWHLYKFIPAGRGGLKNADELAIDQQHYDDACDEVRDMDLGFTIFKRKDMRHSKNVDFFWYEGEKIIAGSEVWDDVPGEEVLV